MRLLLLIVLLDMFYNVYADKFYASVTVLLLRSNDEQTPDEFSMDFLAKVIYNCSSDKLWKKKYYDTADKVYYNACAFYTKDISEIAEKTFKNYKKDKYYTVKIYFECRLPSTYLKQKVKSKHKTFDFFPIGGENGHKLKVAYFCDSSGIPQIRLENS